MNLGIITAAGKGTRLRANINKQFIKLCGKPILAHTINVFQKSKLVDEIFILIPAEFIEYTQKNIISKYGFDKVTRLIIGGETRQETVGNALKFIPDKCEMISVHDGVRPLIYPTDVDLLFKKLLEFNEEDDKVKGVILAAPAYETIKQMDGSDDCVRTIPRETVYHAQTPQTFFKDALLEAYKCAESDKTAATDDAMLVEKIGYKVKIIKGNHENIKITTPIDLFLAELIISKNGVY